MILAAVWSMSTTEKIKMDVTFFLHFDLSEIFFALSAFGRIEFFAHTKTASRENTDARSASERTEVAFLFGSA